jgi:hypothetical protein
VFIAVFTAIVCPGVARPANGPLAVETGQRTYHAAFAWSTTTQDPDGSGNFIHADGFPFARNVVPVIPVRLGQRIRFRSPHRVDDFAVRYGRRRPMSFGSGQTVFWRVPASGTYIVVVTVESSSRTTSSTAEYVVRLRARRR